VVHHYSVDGLEDIAARKGGVRQLLDEKWRKVSNARAAAPASVPLVLP